MSKEFLLNMEIGTSHWEGSIGIKRVFSGWVYMFLDQASDTITSSCFVPEVDSNHFEFGEDSEEFQKGITPPKSKPNKIIYKDMCLVELFLEEKSIGHLYIFEDKRGGGLNGGLRFSDDNGQSFYRDIPLFDGYKIISSK